MQLSAEEKRDDQRERLHLEVQDLRSDMTEVKAGLGANTAMTSDLVEKVSQIQAAHDAARADTAEMLDIFRAMRGSLKVLGWLGRAAAWALGFIVPGLGLYWLLKTGSTSGIVPPDVIPVPPPGGPHP